MDQDQLNFLNSGPKLESAPKKSQANALTPLAHKVRPRHFQGFFGQDQIVEQVKKQIQTKLTHFIFWGPPGCGKTTLANILASETGMEMYHFNAVLGGVKDLRKLIDSAKEMETFSGKKAIIFIDEIHRFNKAQQDALLPYLEEGSFILFGATTEYPQTSLNRAIISRVKLIELNPLKQEELENILKQASELESIEVNTEILAFISQHSNGDARIALNTLESLYSKYTDDLKEKSVKDIEDEIIKNSRHYDKNSNRHYDVISAFIKSIRGSDPDAALLWLAVMLDGGEDPVFIARRLMIAASEDVGNANPNALQMANSAHYTCQHIGMPEARIILAQATTYLASSPKSNAAYKAIDEALDYVRNTSTIEVPNHLRNHHPEKKNYKYPHAFDGHYVFQKYRQDKEHRLQFYRPTNQGFEKNFKNYLEGLKTL
jgi:putative ATPase